MAEFLESAIEIAHQAGSLLRYYFERVIPEKKQRFELKGDFDLVTEADRASEKLIVERLKARFPEHAILAEEGGGHESASEYRWYVDPLDGTTNFAHGYPVYNVTLALEKAGELIAGVIFDPNRDELFTCEKGGGAFLNGARIQCLAAASLDESLFSTGFPSRRRHLDVNIHFYHQLAMATHGVRRGGRGGDRPRLCRLRAARRFLGVRAEPLGHGGRKTAGRQKPEGVVNGYERRHPPAHVRRTSWPTTARFTMKWRRCLPRSSAANTGFDAGDSAFLILAGQQRARFAVGCLNPVFCQ